jgi:hypothetical protein
MRPTVPLGGAMITLCGAPSARSVTPSYLLCADSVYVPGSTWNLMMLRSNDFTGLKTLLDSVYSDFLDQQILIAALQSYWDYTDPISFASHVITDPLPMTPQKRILV